MLTLLYKRAFSEEKEVITFLMQIEYALIPSYWGDTWVTRQRCYLSWV